MSINGSNLLYTQWAGLIGNVNAIADDRGDPFFRKAASRLESFWEERAVSQQDEASAALLSALAQSLTVYSTTESVTKAFVHLLPEVLRISQSPFGFLAEVRYSAVNKPYLYSHAVTDIYKPGFGLYDIVTELQFHNLDTLNGAIMTGRRPVLTNDPPNDPRSGGLPFGHAGLKAFLGLPFLVDDDLVGATSLGNRPGGYSEREVELLAPLCEIGGLIIATDRNR
jgi:GAF domain-containing protein